MNFIGLWIFYILIEMKRENKQKRINIWIDLMSNGVEKKMHTDFIKTSSPSLYLIKS